MKIGEDDVVNGTQLLLTEIDTELKKRLSSKDKVLLKSSKYLLLSLTPMREDIVRLKKHDFIRWAGENPKTTWLMVAGLLVVTASVNWEVLRKPIMQSIIYAVTGVMIPASSLP